MGSGFNISISISDTDGIWGLSDEDTREWLLKEIKENTKGVMVGGDLCDVLTGEVTVNRIGWWTEEDFGVVET